MILNFKLINTLNPQCFFRTETLASSLPTIERTYLAVLLDLKDAYFYILSIPVCGITWEGETIRFCALPFSLRPAPRFFTHVAALATFLRNRGLRTFVYLLGSLKSDLQDQLRLLLQTTQKLGFLANWEKSELPQCTQVQR